jgi:lipoprotein-releasing system permease protein
MLIRLVETMYAPLLANRYLTSRIIPFIAVAAVALCVALVIVVVSVMSGFLEMVRASGKTMTGDVVISRPITGMPYYQELIKEIEALPEAAAASPIVETFGLLQMQYGTGDGGKQIEMVEVWGIDPASLDRVADYGRKLYWSKPGDAALATMAPDDPLRNPFYHREADGMRMATADGRPGLVLGIEISPFNRRGRDGAYRTSQAPGAPQDADYFMPNAGKVILTLVPVSEGGSLGGERKRDFTVVNEFQSGLFQIDANRILVPLPVAQEMLRLDAAPMVSRTEFDEDGRPKVIGESPSRATTIVVRARPGVDPVTLRDAVRGAYARFHERISLDKNLPVNPPFPDLVSIETWEERLADFIGPVEKERELMRTLFSIVYIVCAGLVLAIFWSIVQEKTRDIGILRAVGASRTGVLWIFLRYGLLIGIVGSAIGVLLAWAIIARINDIHTLLGTAAPGWLRVVAWVVTAGMLGLTVRGTLRASALHVVLWGFGTAAMAVVSVVLLQHEGFLIWDPSVYYFSRIPDTLDWHTAWTTMAGGIIFSVIGASIPAARAADTDPVKSLRYE